MNPDRIFSIANRVQSIAIEEPEIKELAQKAVSAYVRRVFLLPDKELFDVSRIDVDALANSYGLAITPEIRFLKKGSKKLSEKNLRKQISAFGLSCNAIFPRPPFLFSMSLFLFSS